MDIRVEDARSALSSSRVRRVLLLEFPEPGGLRMEGSKPISARNYSQTPPEEPPS